MNDLTKSTVDRQNVLNNKYAVEKLQEYLGLTGMLFNNEYKFTIQQVTDFYVVDRGTLNLVGRNNVAINHFECPSCTASQQQANQFEYYLAPILNLTRLSLNAA